MASEARRDLMKFPASDKTASFGRKPHIKKGYYPAQLLDVKEYKDKDGNYREGKYGRQLIFEFAIYKSHMESGVPTEPLQYKPDAEEDKMQDVIIPKFVYHQYKAKDANGKETGEFQTAITPNSAITKILKALGWEFSPEGVEIDDLIGNWVEVNVDDFEAEDDGEKYKASTIKDVNSYDGPEPGDVRKATPKEPKNVEKQIKHEAFVQGSMSEEEASIMDKKAEMAKLRDEGLLTEEGFQTVTKNFDAKLAEIRKGKK